MLPADPERTGALHGICPRCDAHPRHRLLWLYLSQQFPGLLDSDLQLLHVAPEYALLSSFRAAPQLRYVSFDLGSPLAQCHGDLEALPFADNRFDVVLCNHVFEHVADDRQAMAEVYRVLAPGCWALLQVPVDLSRDATCEDPSIDTPAGRREHFGQADHLRVYGRDYAQRLEAAGFSVEVIDYVRQLSSDTVERFGLNPDEPLYIGRKGGGPPS